MNIIFFFFNDTATTEIYTLSLHELFRSQLDAGQMLGYPEVEISMHYFITSGKHNWEAHAERTPRKRHERIMSVLRWHLDQLYLDRKSTRLNSSHTVISYAVFCLTRKHAT